MRTIGDNPRAVDMKGVKVPLYQFLGVVFGGIMAGLGGSFLTLASAGLFMPGIVAGRGWIALAIVILGNWKPWSILISALFFGFLDTFQLQVQGIGIQLPLSNPGFTTLRAYDRGSCGRAPKIGVAPFFRQTLSARRIARVRISQIGLI